MPQKILAGRAADTLLHGELVEVKVDQVILTRAPGRAVAEARALGLKKTPVEFAVAYDGICVTDGPSSLPYRAGDVWGISPDTSSSGILIARPGVGFAGPVHLERFASPARLAVTDDPRMCSVGGIGMLALVVSPFQLGRALATGAVELRPPRSVQVLLSGRARPFVCARDLALELVRRGLRDSIRRIDSEYGAPVVIEFAGPSARLLSVPERAVLCAIAPALGAASAVFVSDEKSEVFLRDQRRSKAHRALAPDAGAPCDEVISLDISTVDPLLMEENGEVRPVRDLAGKPVHQVIIGGDSGITLRDMLAAAALLKSKRVPPKLDLLVAPPSRQVLEVLASTGALVDLVATGARIIEPDARVITGEIYPPGPDQTSVRAFDPEPSGVNRRSFIVASAETIAYTVATGEIGDPRGFKRPVRVTVPRVFPTEDVLIVRPRKADASAPKKPAALESAPRPAWSAAQTLDVVAGMPASSALNHQAFAMVLQTDDDIRRAAAEAVGLTPRLRAIIAGFVPSWISATLTGMGIAVFSASAEVCQRMATAKQLSIPEAAQWPVDGSVTCHILGSEDRVGLTWLGKAAERRWLVEGMTRPARR